MPSRSRFISLVTRYLGLSVGSLLLLLAVVFWGHGLLHSPLLDENWREHATAMVDQGQQQRELLLAQGYWRRYRDIRLHPHWGENGTLGIDGPRDHYRQHGHREGRIFQPLVIPEDLAAEKVLAESYWRRYPEVRDSWVWGERADLGILGPRDHYIHVGSGLGYRWGPEAPKDQLTKQSSRKQP